MRRDLKNVQHSIDGARLQGALFETTLAALDQAPLVIGLLFARAAPRPYGRPARPRQLVPSNPR